MPDDAARPRARVAPGRVRLLGLGLALPGEAVPTSVLCARLEARFGVPAERLGRRLAARLQVHTRHLCRGFEAAIEAPRAGQRNPELPRPHWPWRSTTRACARPTSTTC